MNNAQLLSMIGTPSVLISLGIILYKMKPITFLSASRYERMLYTKESKFIYSIFWDIVSVLWLAITMLALTHIFSNIFSIYIDILAYILITLIFLHFIWCYFSVQFGKGLLIRELDKPYRTYLNLSHLIIYFLGLITLGYFFASIINLKDSHFLNYIILYIFFIFLSILYVYYYKLIISVIEITRNTDLYLYIKYQENIGEGEDQNWYVFHSTFNDKFLLGNNCTIEKCSMLKIIDRNELLDKYIINIQENRKSM